MKKSCAIGIALTVCCLISSCKRQSFTISGHLDHGENSYLYIDEINPDGIAVLDTLLLIQGNFSYTINGKAEGIYRLRLNDSSFISFIGGDNDQLRISGDADSLIRSYRISGNRSSTILWEANRRVDGMYHITDSLSRLFKQAQREGRTDSLIPILDSCYFTHFLSCKNFLQHLIENNPDQLAILPLFYQRVGTRRFFSEEQDSVLFQEIVRQLEANYPENKHTLALNERYRTRHE